MVKMIRIVRKLNNGLTSYRIGCDDVGTWTLTAFQPN